MKEYAERIAINLDLEPKHFIVCQDQNRADQIIVKAIDNVLPLAFGRHEIIFDRSELDALSKSVK